MQCVGISAVCFPYLARDVHSSRPRNRDDGCVLTVSAARCGQRSAAQAASRRNAGGATGGGLLLRRGTVKAKGPSPLYGQLVNLHAHVVPQGCWTTPNAAAKSPSLLAFRTGIFTPSACSCETASWICLFPFGPAASR